MTDASAPSRAVTARLRGVHKSYGPVRVLDLPELDLNAGQVIGVVGENGAGKSTLMGTLAGSVLRTAARSRSTERLALGSTAAARPARRGPGLPGVPAGRPAVGGGEPAARPASRRPAAGVLVDRRRSERRPRRCWREIGLPALDRRHREVRTLPVPARQMIEIAKALGPSSRSC